MSANDDYVDALEESLDLELGDDAPLWAHKIARIVVRTYRRTAAIDGKIESRGGLISQINAAHSRATKLEADVSAIKIKLDSQEATDNISIAQTSKGLAQKAIEWAFIALLVWAASQGSCTKSSATESVQEDSAAQEQVEDVDNIED